MKVAAMLVQSTQQELIYSAAGLPRLAAFGQNAPFQSLRCAHQAAGSSSLKPIWRTADPHAAVQKTATASPPTTKQSQSPAQT